MCRFNCRPSASRELKRGWTQRPEASQQGPRWSKALEQGDLKHNLVPMLTNDKTWAIQEFELHLTNHLFERDHPGSREDQHGTCTLRMFNVLQSAAGFIAIPLFASLLARPNLPRVVGWTEFNYSIHVLVLRNASRYLYIHLLIYLFI